MKNKVLKKFLVILILFFLVFLIIFGRKFYLINRIVNKVNKNSSITNWRLSSVSESDKTITEALANEENYIWKMDFGNEEKIKFYFIKDKNKLYKELNINVYDLYEFIENNKTVEIFKMALLTEDELDTEKIKILDDNDLNYNVIYKDSGDMYNIRNFFTLNVKEELSLKDKIKATFVWSIKLEEINGKKCYHINKHDNNLEVDEFWIDKENCYKLKEVYDNGLERYYTGEVNTVTEEEFILPDLSSYTVLK